MNKDKKINDVLICGVGGVGGYFGGKIAYKINKLVDKKKKIYFLARGAHLKEIIKNGLIINTPEEKGIICKPTMASDNLLNIPFPDLCIICVKSYDLDDLVIKLAKFLKEDTIIIPLLNGIDIYERIRKNLNKCIVFPSCVYVGSHIEKPGVVTQSGNPGFFYCGKDPKFPDFNPQPVFDFFKDLGFGQYNIPNAPDPTLSMFNWRDNPYQIIWEKYLLVASFALVTAFTGKTLGGVIFNNESLELLTKVMQEIVEIAEKKKIKLSDNIISKTIEFCKAYPDIKTSYQRDIEKGKKNEGDLFGGTIIRLGQELNVPTPVTKSLYTQILTRAKLSKV